MFSGLGSIGFPQLAEIFNVSFYNWSYSSSFSINDDLSTTSSSSSSSLSRNAIIIIVCCVVGGVIFICCCCFHSDRRRKKKGKGSIFGIFSTNKTVEVAPVDDTNISSGMAVVP